MSAVGDAIARLASIGDKPSDTDEELFAHRFMVYMGLAMSLGGVLWGTICLAYGLLVAATVPYGYTILTAANFAVFRRTKNFTLARGVQVSISLLLPFLLQWALGGFTTSGAMMLWAMLALVGSFSFSDRRFSYYVLAGFLALTIVSGLIEGSLADLGFTLEVDASVSTLFVVLNICVIGTSVFLLTYFLVQRQLTAARLERLDKVKSDFLSTVSHEIRTPLTSIVGFTEMVEKKLDESIFPEVTEPSPKVAKHMTQVQRNLSIMRAEGDRLTELINDVLDLTKMEAGAIDWRDEVVEARDVIEHSVASTSALFHAKDSVRLVLDVDDDLPDLRGDRHRLIQVMVNLLSNAVKFTETGTVIVEAAPSEGGVLIRVLDEGVGLQPEDLERVFQRFRQVGDTMTGKPKGTGLGLPISRRIVEHHGGRIWAERREDRGAVFNVHLPVRNEPTPLESVT